MTNSVNPPGIPVTPARGEPDDEERVESGPTVGASDADADAVRSGADADLTDAARDTDGVPVGEDDAEADRRASGA